MDMYFTVEKIASRVRELQGYIYRHRMPVRGLRYIVAGQGAMASAKYAAEDVSKPEYDDSEWLELTPGARWGGRDVTIWVRGRFGIPEDWRRSYGNVALHIHLSERQGRGGGPEGLLYVDGAPIQGIDVNHTEAILPASVVNSGDGNEKILTIKATSGMHGSYYTFETAELVLIDKDVQDLYYLLNTGIGTVNVLGDNSPQGSALLNVLDEATRLIDWRKPGSNMFYDSAKNAANYLRSALAGLSREGIRPKVVCVGHSHIDVAWLWPLRHTREKCARTFSTVTNLMDLYPDYYFIQSQPQLYKFIKEDHPEIYARIKEKVASGQWEPTGGMWVEADCNLISGESLVRQFLFGTRFFREEFGKECKVLWLPDVFGYSWALPQIIKKSGLEYFMTTKISWSQYNRPQYDTFSWRGIDGTEVLTHFITTPANDDVWFYTYNGDISPKTIKGIWDSYREKRLNDELLLSFGHGDGGGGPTRSMIETAKAFKEIPGMPEVELGKAEPFFDRLAERVKGEPHLPVWDGELYLEYHRGTYTSQAQNKRANRRSEILYHDAEAFSSLAHAMGRKFSYPQKDLNHGWELILLNQFHDIIPGSSIREVYEDSEKQYEEIMNIGHGTLRAALDHIVKDMELKKEAIVVFNSLSWERSDVVVVPWNPAFEGKVFVDSEGRKVRSQVVESACGAGASSDTCKELLLFVEGIPALGYKAIYLEDDSPSCCQDADDGSPSCRRDADSVVPDCQSPASSSSECSCGECEISVTPAKLENSFFNITLNSSGQIKSVWDKIRDREVLAPGERANVLQVFEDKPLRFDAWDIDIFYKEKMWEVTDLAEVTVEEEGPERGVLRLVWRFMDSVITQRMTIYRSIARVDFRTEVDWRESQMLLKAAFPVDIRATKATFEIQFGNVERPTHWNTSWDFAKFETCGHKWVDMSEGGYGVSLLNDCKYGHDVKDNVIRLTLLKSAINPDPKADKRHHVFTYSLYPHAEDWYRGRTVNEAYSLNYPLAAVYVGACVGYGASSALGSGRKQGTLPDTFSFASSNAQNVIVETVKKAEDSDAIVVRVYEYGNRRGPVTLTFGFPIKDAKECNLVERNESPARFDGRNLDFFIKPYEIKTFLVKF